MLPQKVLDKYREEAALYFQCEDERLMKAVDRLADAGWTWDSMRELVAFIYNSGYDLGYDDGMDYQHG